MNDDLKQRVRAQFGAHAAGYVAAHRSGADLDLMIALAGLTGRENVLDVATGTGNTAIAFVAAGAGQVIGLDLTPEMLAEARRQAEEQGFGNTSFVEGDAEGLPFGSDSFEIITCRVAAHHFPDIPAFCREAARVLKPGGLLLVADNVAPEDDELDRFINTVEKLRDPSHARACRISEWEQLITDAGLRFATGGLFPFTIMLEPWLQRAGVSPDVGAEVRRMLAEAPPHIRDAFGVQADRFAHHRAVLTGRKPVAWP
jgi:SAM-dependent methyltransferase